MNKRGLLISKTWFMQKSYLLAVIFRDINQEILAFIKEVWKASLFVTTNHGFQHFMDENCLIWLTRSITEGYNFKWKKSLVSVIPALPCLLYPNHDHLELKRRRLVGPGLFLFLGGVVLAEIFDDNLNFSKHLDVVQKNK